MASYDSDSGSDDENYTETNVLLGYATKEATDDTSSQLGGHATWLDEQSAPPGDFAKCKNCNQLLTLLLQLNGDLPERFPGHERRLYLFACKRKTCRRKDGSVRGYRAIRPTHVPEPEQKQPSTSKPQEETQQQDPTPAPKTHIGESLFGVSKPAASSTSINPFSTNPSQARPANPFAQSPSTQPQAPAPQQQQQQPSLSETFASKARISSPEPTSTPAPTGPREPWPSQSDFPPAYPTYFLDADYETLDAPKKSEIPSQARLDMDIDGNSSTTVTADDEKAAFESIMDKTFQRFADRLSQNPEQVLRYEFAGQPLLYSKTDPVGRVLAPFQDAATAAAKVKTNAKSGMPRCGNCGAERVFEVQLTPGAIAELEAEELSLEGMEWGTVIMGVCSKDCLQRGQKEGQVDYIEEWAGVQWEELAGKK